MPTVPCNACCGEGVFRTSITGEVICVCPACNGVGSVWKDEHKKKVK